MSTRQPSELPADAAYSAARDRALRTTDALILAEGQVFDLSRRLDAALAEVQTLSRRVRELEDVRPAAETYAATAAGEGGGGDGDADPVGYTAAIGQAD